MGTRLGGGRSARVLALAGLARGLDDTALGAALDPEGAPLLAELVPGIRPRLPPAPALSAAPPDEARFRLWRAVVSLVRATAAPSGLVLVFDDLHSADRSSLLLLYALARELRSLRVLLLATCRDVEARLDADASDLIFSRIAREGTTLTLPRLDRDASTDLLRGRHPAALAAELEARIFDRAQGNPLFLVEMLRLLDDEGPASIAAGVVPSGVRDVIRQRLARLADDTRQLVNLAAVAGDEVNPTLLAAASGRDAGWVAGRVADASRAGILGQRAGRPWFSHALVREVLYRELAADERAALHAAVGGALERTAGGGVAPPVTELAHHALEAGADLSRAVDLAVRAAARSAAVGAIDQSILILERAVAALDAAAGPPVLRARVLLALAEARIGKIIAHVKASAGKAPAAKPVNVVDGDSALAEVTQLLGSAPEFLQRFPAAARAGAWRQMRDLQMSPATATSGKNKELMGLAVASQVPCRYCIIAHTEFAKLNGATDGEIAEAIAMAAFTRDMSTLLNGMQVDEAQFRKDVERLVKNVT